MRDVHDPSDRRKRPAEEEDATRPIKRPRSDVNGASQERVRTPKHDGMRNGSSEVSRKKEIGIARAKSPRPESKPSASLEPNGRTILKAAIHPNRGTSPDSRSRAGSLNGVRPNSSGSAKSTSIRAAAGPTSKPSVLPLLSPLHLSFNDSDTGAKIKEGRRDDGMESHRGKAERIGVSKKHDSRAEILPLLSPTLPPILEAELARRKKTSKVVESRSPASSKKAQPARDEDEEPPKKSLVITLKYNKRVAKRVQRLLALPARKERSTSIDSQSAQLSGKRPLPYSGGTITVDASDSIASKRPRQVEHASKTLAPSTPLRPSIPLPHHVNTPGEVGFEPLSQKVLLANVPPNVEALKQRYQRYKVLGTTLKHTRDDVVKNFPPTNGVRLMPDTELKLSTVTGIEAILSYMVGFNALSEARHIERKPKDHALWKSLLPLVNELQLSVRELAFPKAILSILQERVLQEIVGCLLAGDFRNQGLLQDLHRVGREHDKVKRLLPVLFRQVEIANEDVATGLQLPVIYSGEPAEQAASKTLLAMKSWVARERVDWEATLSTEEILSGI